MNLKTNVLLWKLWTATLPAPAVEEEQLVRTQRRAWEKARRSTRS